MHTIYLVRHTEYSNPRNILHGRLPVELSEKGKSQALVLQKYFADKNITTIFSSAVLRCKQTSEIISNNNIPIKYDKRLLETFSAYQGYWFEGALDWDHFFSHREELGGEGYPDVQARVSSFFNEVALKQKGNIILCSHGDPLYVLYLYLINRQLPNEMDELGDGGNPTYQSKGSVREVSVHEDGSYSTQDFIPVDKLITS